MSEVMVGTTLYKNLMDLSKKTNMPVDEIIAKGLKWAASLYKANRPLNLSMAKSVLITKDKREEIAACIENGEKLKNISKKFGISISSVYNIKWEMQKKKKPPMTL